MSLAIIFPGQGSQSIGMLATLAKSFSVVKRTFDEASSVLDYDLWKLCQSGPEERLNQTEFTQVALLAAGVAGWRVLPELKIGQPHYLTGHSLGEYTALVCAEALNFTDAVKCVAARGRFMQNAVSIGTGAMAAVLGLAENAVSDLCAEASMGEILSAANYNSPGQVVIAGQKAAVDRAIDLAKQHGARRVVLLSVSVPSHCALMQPAAEQLALQLANTEFKTPKLPVLHNIDGLERKHPDDIREALVQQLVSPVQWVRCVQNLAAAGVDTVFECGPGKVLAALVKRIESQMTCNTLAEVEQQLTIECER
jgi:[acyl-carrier-protein] S-malonyltransferase